MGGSVTTTERSQAEATAQAARPWRVLALLATAQLMLVLDVTVVNVALPDISASLGLAQTTVPWVMTIYTLFFGGLVLSGGRLADRHGPRNLTIVGLALFVASSALTGLAGRGSLLLAGRALQGISAAVLSPAALATALGYFPGPDRRRALAVWSGLAGIGSALGVILGGVITAEAGWRWVFGINVPIGVALLAVVPVVTRHQRPRDPAAAPGSDLAGAVLVTAGTGSAIYGVISGGHGWTSIRAIVPLLAAALLWTAFVLVERATPRPLLRVDLLTRPPVATGAFLMLTATGLLVGAFFLGSFTLQHAHGYSALRTGLCFIPAAAGTVAGAHVGGELLTRLSARAVTPAGFVLAALGYAAPAVSDRAAPLIAGLSVAAFGIGTIFVAAFTASLGDASPAEAGLRSAIVNTFHELGGAAGVSTLSSIAGAALVTARPAGDAFRHAFTAGTIAAVISAVVAVFLVPRAFRDPAGDRPAH
jgi:EmrB/QacA subfamily drug resistance transporter